MASYVLKIKYENNLRRLTLQKEEVATKSFSFSYLETRIRELLQLPATSTLAITYTDQENDVITMGSDQDLKDALVDQELNPLRIHVTLVNGAGMGPQERVDLKPSVFKRLGKDLTVEEAFKSALQSCEPLLESCVKSRDQVLQDIAAKFNSAVKLGSTAATPSVYGTQTPRLGAFQPYPNTQPPRHNLYGSFGGTSGPAGPSRHNLWGGLEGTSGPAGPSVASEGVTSGSQTTSTVHHGVTCDVCGLTPIVGNRWKSIVKFDYDLCSDCYEKNGNETDFAKVEQPKFRPRHRYGPPSMGPAPDYSSLGIPPPLYPTMNRHGHGHFHGGRPFGMRHPFGGFGGRHHFGPSSAEKLYARFVSDVTVFDGTEVAPGTHFVKIWRLRNSGTAPWPVNTTLVFVGGDELGHVQSVPLEIPPQGLGPEAEMEVSVDMIAPEKPGRYVSHWRLSSPLGPKFGQRLSVVIQVVPQGSLEDAHDEAQLLDVEPAPQSSVEDTHDEGQRLDLQPAPQSSLADAYIEEQMLDIEPAPESSQYAHNQEQMPELEEDMRSTTQTDESGGVSKTIENVPLAEQYPQRVEDFVRGFVAPPVSSTEFEGSQDEGSITYPVVDATVSPDAEPITYPVVDAAVSPDAEPIAYPVVDPTVAEDLEPERQLLVGRLVAMGFTDSQLNSELLEKNGNDIRKTLDDLCVAEEWDPMLEELEEMGFYDTATNRRLMFKNNGSVKRVVKELVEMYRDGQGKGGKLVQ